MKKSYVSLLLLASLFLYYSFSSNPPNGRTGAPGESTCASGCHTPNNPNFAGSIDITGLDANIIPGQTYPLTITLTDDVNLAIRGGFQITNVGPDQIETVGSFSNPSSNTTVTVSGIRTYAEHNPADNFTNGTVVYTVDWTAPSDLSDGDQIDFYGVGVIANGSGNSNDLFVQQQLSGIIEVPMQNLIVDIINITPPSCSDSDDGSAEAQVSGGVPPYSFSWISGEEGNIASMLSAGINEVTVMDSDNNVEVVSFELSSPEAITIVESTVSIGIVLCEGDSNGSISVPDVIGGTGNISYEWSTGDTTTSISNLVAGIYTLTLTDDANCSIDTSFVLEEGNSIIVSIDELGSSCNDSMDIRALTVPSNPLNIFNWDSGDSTEIITAFPSIIYNVTVTDENGCTATDDFFYNLNNGLQASLSVQGSGPFEISTDVSGGATNNYTYLWVETNETTPSIIVDTIGTFQVMISDGICTITESITIETTCELNIDSLVLTDPTCTDDINGMISLMASFSFDTSALEYIWNTGDSTNTITNLEAGEYSVTITSAMCIDSATFTLINPPTLEINFDSILPSQSNPTSGEISANVINGNPPFNFEWSTGDSTNMISNLSAGQYFLTVIDSLSCSVIDSITLELLECNIVSELIIDSIFCAGDLASVQLSTNIPLGLNPKFEWSTGDTTSMVDSLATGAYEITISDDSNCEDTLSFVIDPFVPAMIEVDSMSTISCDNPFALIGLNIDWGFAPFDIIWSNGETGSIANEIDEEGEISVIITNSRGCITTDTFFVEKEIPPAPTASFETGTVSLNQNGIFSGFPDIPANLLGTCEDSLFVVMDSVIADCSNLNDTIEVEVLFFNRDEILDTFLVDVVVRDELAPIVEVNTNISFLEFCGFADTTIVFDASNVFAVDNCSTIEIESFVLEIELEETEEVCGSYSIEDESGNQTDFEICVFTVVYSQPFAVYEQTNIPCFGGNEGCVEFGIIGGTAPFNIAGDPFCDLIAGNYEYFIEDFNGCTADFSVEITEPEELIITVIDMQSETPGQSDGSIDVSVTGGVEPYEFIWTENGVVVSNFEDLINFPSSQYRLTVIDQNGCETLLSTFIDVVSSTSDKEIDVVELVQNPVYQTITLNKLPIGSRINILSLEGKVMYNNLATLSETESIPVSNWPSGMYFCHIEHEGKRQVIRVVKM